jgi:hypothetical protein
VLTGFLRFISAILLFLVVVSLPLTLLARDMGQLIFDADTIKELVSENLLAPEFVARVAENVTVSAISTAMEEEPVPDEIADSEQEEGLDMSLMTEAFSYLEEEDWIEITTLIAPPDLVGETVNGLVDGYVAWLDNEDDFPALRFELAPWKANLRTHSSSVVAILLDALPACTAEEIAAQMLAGLEEGESLGQVLTPVCRPTEPLYSTMLGGADRMVGGLTARMPDSVDTSVLGEESAPEELVLLKQNLQRARLILSWSWLLVAGVGALAVWMASRSLPEALRRASWPLLFAGGITLLIGGLIQLAASGGLQALFTRMFADGPGAIAALGTAVIAGVFPLVAQPLLIQGAFLAALGLGALIAAPRLAAAENDDFPELKMGY